MSTVIDLGKLRFLFRGDYNNGTSYELNDVVTYGGNSYTYINVTAGAGTNPDSTSHWSLMTRGITLRGDWDAATQYVAGDIAKLNGIHYKCKATTTNNIPPNSTYWEEFIQGFNYTGNWSAATQYRKNDIAIQNGVNYICVTAHVNQDPPGSNWNEFAMGYSDRGAWNNSTDYEVNDLVSLSGIIYKCKADNVCLLYTSDAADE